MNIPVSYGADRNKRTSAYAIIASAMLTIMLVAQLYGFEAFDTVLSTLVATNDSRELHILAAVIVIAELIALPYLLRMYISRLMRIVSAAAAFLISGFWLFVAFTNSHAENSGLFSDAVQVPGGLLAALWGMVLFALVCRVIYTDSRFRHATT